MIHNLNSTVTLIYYKSWFSNTIILYFAIVYAGETSSGKSSLLNLLLGREVLPHRLLSCTSVICQLKYGPTLSAKVTNQHGVVQDIDLDQDCDPVQQLSKYIYREDHREGPPQYKSVEIFLPLELLKV